MPTRSSLELGFALAASALATASFFGVMGVAGPEPFFGYDRGDAIQNIGVCSAIIGLWIVWILGVVCLVLFGVFRMRWLWGLLLATVCVFYLQMAVGGYLDDLEDFMLASEERQKIERPRNTS